MSPARKSLPIARAAAAACPPKPRPAARALLSAQDADRLAAVFEVLAHGTRLRLLHALVRAGEMRLMHLAAEVAMTPQAVSNQLRRLADRGIVSGRREGAGVLYRIADPCVIDLLDRGMCLREDAEKRT